MPLFFAGLITTIVTVVLFVLDKKTKFGKWHPFLRQTIIGVLFGLCAAYSTELGSISINGAALNCRDAGPVIAGLLFGPWSGVLAGAIGAIDRFFIATPVFGIGEYTCIACSIATLFAGCFAGLFHVLLFKDHRPFVLHALVFISITEVIHMGLVPITHFDDMENATLVMYNVFLPLLLSNAAVVGVSFFITSYIDMRFKGHKIREIIFSKDIFFTQDLFFSFQFWLLCIIVFSFIVSVVGMSYFNDRTSLQNTETRFASELTSMKKLLLQDAETLHVNHRDMAKIYTRDWSDSEVSMYFAVDSNTGEILSSERGIPELYQECVNNQPEMTLFSMYHDSTRYYVMYSTCEDFTLVEYSIEKYEMFTPHLNSSFIMFLQILVFGLMMFCVFMLLKKLVGENLQKINESLEAITSGNLNEKVEVYSHKEFATLSTRINATVDTLKDYIQAEADRFKEDFEMARQIQLSALPNVFPPFPENKEVDLYAKYQSAKEVGGDFYDYYFVNKNTLAFLIADVSGKGIPAAMFMMRVKTAIRVFAEKHVDAAKTLKATNDYLNENNEAELFVTCWLGFVNTDTGLMQYSTAGHNPPVLINDRTGKCEFLEAPISLVLGGMEGIEYKNAEYQMQPGEKILLYTDGITEAHNEKSELYGETTIIDFAQKNINCDVKLLCENLFQDVENFAGDADQFDDETVLAFIYKGKQKKKIEKLFETEISVFARTENVTRVCERLEEILPETNAPLGFTPKFCVAIDEIFSNIVKYGYKDESKYITVRVQVDERDEAKKAVKVTFVDAADRFNPLDESAPDITLSAEEREVGGLGIYMVRKLMDDVFYIYKDKANNLTIVKYFGEDVPEN